jgi:hypothetical protein
MSIFNPILFTHGKGGYCGFPLKETGKRYGGITGTAVNKVVTRFKKRLSRDKSLREKMEHILSFDEM